MELTAGSYSQTDRLAYTDKTFIPARIPVSHWQLRHYISSPDKDTIYYASGNEVYHLNTVTKKRKHLTTLPFEARCTASGYGYVCVGGEDEGHFAIIKLESTRPTHSYHIDVDAPLPIEDYWQTSPPLPPRAVNVKVERIGDEIVNSVSVHKIQDEEAHLYDVVAVLTNNDRTVRVYSLQQGVETTCLDLPFPMNHASISPDGKVLVAVGDSNQAFFYTRAIQEEPPQIPKPHNRLNMTAVTWELTNLVHLRAEPVPRDPTQAPGYFTTAWSPSGHLVAVGSEGGHISVFDTQLMQDCAEDEGDEAIIATIPSTRPNIAAHLHPGAVRTIIFSPEPWDLLIWAEDQGRVCIADLRTGLRTQQVIELKPDEEGMNRIEMADDVASESATLEEQTHLSELEEALLHHGSEAGRASADFMEARERLRQQQNLRRDFPSLAETTTLEDDPRGLTAHEQQILDSLRLTRQRAEARQQGSLPRSVNYTTPALFSPSSLSSSHTPPRESGSSRPFSDVLVNHNDPYAAFPELSRTHNLSFTRESSRIGDDNTLPPLRSIQEYLRLRDRREQDRTQQGARNNPPPIHASRAPLLVPPHDSDDEVNNANITNEDDEATEAENQDNQNQDSPWRTITEAMNLAHGPLFERIARTYNPTSSNNPQAASASTPDPYGRSSPPAGTAYSTSTPTEHLLRIAQQRSRLRSIRREFDPSGSTNANSNNSNTNTNTNSNSNSNSTNNAPPTHAPARPMHRMVIPRSQQLSYDEYTQILLARRSTPRDVNIGVRTAGLAMSQDGRVLFVACEDGIFEIDINVKSRMVFPSVEMR